MTARRLAAVLLALAGLGLLAPVAARADAVSGAELRALARAARDDPAALARLRQVDRVDGAPVAIGAALRGARGAQLRARLALLAAAPVAARAGGDPRSAARDVLAERRFHEPRVTGPFRRALAWIGDRVKRLDRLLNPLDVVIPGPRAVVWVVLSALVFLIAALVARRTLSRRIRVAAEAAAAALPSAEDPRALERRASAAEAAGELETALRLRFRAGLLRLDERGAIEFRPSISTYEVRRALRSPDFDALAATFDDVVYGGRAAEPDDVAAARRQWPAVVKAVPREAAGRAAARAPPSCSASRCSGCCSRCGPWRGSRPPRAGPRSSSYATSPAGLAAYASLLERSGLTVRRLRRPVADRAPGAEETLVVLDPSVVDPDEARAIGRLGARAAGGSWPARRARRVLAATRCCATRRAGGPADAGGRRALARSVRRRACGLCARRTAGAGSGSAAPCPSSGRRGRRSSSSRAAGAAASCCSADASPLQNRLLGAGRRRRARAGAGRRPPDRVPGDRARLRRRPRPRRAAPARPAGRSLGLLLAGLVALWSARPPARAARGRGARAAAGRGPSTSMRWPARSRAPRRRE